MNSWSLKRTLGWGMSSMLVLIFAALGVADYMLWQSQKTVDRVTGIISQRVALIGIITRGTESAWAAEQTALASLLTRQRTVSEESWKQAQTAHAEVTEAFARLGPLLEIPANKVALEKVGVVAAAWNENSKQVYRLMHQGQVERATLFSQARSAPLHLEVIRTAEIMRQRHSELMATEQRASMAAYRVAQWTTGLSMTLCLGLGGGLLWLFWRRAEDLRNHLGELGQGGEQVAAAAGQIASSSQSLSQGASEQAASLEQVSASMEEMAAMTKRNAENSSQAMAMMVQTGEQVERSNHALQDMEASMSAMKASSEKVAKINKTIDEIAFQTNILALNAAVEAARAGSAGMGFAVVAGEVRNLAQRSAVAAKDTAVLIGEAIASSNESVAKLEHVSQAIQAITEGAGKVKNLVDEVNEASKQQAQGIEQVATAISQVSKVTQTTAASAEESAAASQQLSAQSRVVRQLVELLQVAVDGGAGTSAGHESNRRGQTARSGARSGYQAGGQTGRPAGRPGGGADRQSGRSRGAAGGSRPAVNATVQTKLAPVAAASRRASSVAEKEFPLENAEDGGFHSF